MGDGANFTACQGSTFSTKLSAETFHKGNVIKRQNRLTITSYAIDLLYLENR